MRLRRITPYHIRVPLKFRFKHAGAERDYSDNIVVEVELEDGTRGYGECVPREYVTGETVEGVLAAYRSLKIDEDFRRYGEVEAFFKAWQFRGNAARTAVELAALDAFGRYFRTSVGDTAKRDCHFFYSGVVGRDGVGALLKMKLYGFREVKLKVGFGDDEDISRVKMARRVLGDKVDIRLDANGAWHFAQADALMCRMAEYNISSVEQPLKRGEEVRLPRLRERTKIPIVLDESLCTEKDAERAIKEGGCDSFNIRLSKCGGLLPSLRIAELARSNNLRFQLGAQVGETGILSAAGRAFATRAPDVLHLEGSYDRFLLKRNSTAQHISFGYRGRAFPLRGYGLGMEVLGENLCKMKWHG